MPPRSKNTTSLLDDTTSLQAIADAALRSNPDGVSYQAMDYTILYANPTLERLLGVPAEKLVGRKCYQVFHGTDAPIPICPAKMLAHGEDEWEETFFEPRLGKWIWVRTAKAQLPDGTEGFVHTVRDVTRLKEAEEKAENDARRLSTLLKLTESLASEGNLKEKLKRVLQIAIQELNMEAGKIYLYRPEREVLERAVIVKGGESDPLFVALGEKVSGAAALSEDVIVIDDASSEAAHSRFPSLRGKQPHSILAAPLRKDGRLLGVINLAGKPPRRFNNQEIALFREFATRLASVIEHHILYDELQRSVGELEKNRRFLQKVVDAAPVGIMIADRAGRIVSWNREAERLTGWRKEEVVGKVCPFLETGMCAWRPPLCQRKRKPQVGRKIQRFVRKDGSIRFLNRTYTLLEGEDGEPVGTIGCFDDVTETVRVQRQHALLLKIARQRLLGKTFRDLAQSVVRPIRQHMEAKVFCLYSWDGYSGSPFLEAQSGLPPQVARRLRRASESASGWSRLLMRLEEGRPFLCKGNRPGIWQELFPDENLLVVPIGQKDVLLGFMLAVGPPPCVCGEAGLTFLMALSKEIEATLRQGELVHDLENRTRRLRFLYELGQASLSTLDLDVMLRAVADKLEEYLPEFFCSIHILDRDGQTMTVRASYGPEGNKYVGAKSKATEGITGLAWSTGKIVYVPNVKEHPRYMCWNPSTRSELVLPLVGRKGVIGLLNLESSEEDGFSEEDIRTFSTVAAQVTAAVENVVLFEEVLHNAWELAIQTEKAKQANELKSQFLSNVSHELRTPLNAILGYTTHVLQRSDRLGKEEQRSLERVVVSGQRLLRLINDLLDLSKIEAGKLDIQPEKVDLRRAALTALTSVEPQAKEKGLELDLEVPPDVGEVETDPLRLNQILVNLLGNAVKFTESGHVRLKIWGTEEEVTLAVEDTGKGIPEEEREAIFDSFRQVDGSATRRAGGTGLGLAVSRKLAQLLGGQLTVESEVGKGSTFFLKLPRRFKPFLPAPVEANQRSDGSAVEAVVHETLESRDERDRG